MNREYIIRQLAHAVLETDRGAIDRVQSADAAGSGEVSAHLDIEMRGMVQTIRREILLQHVDLAGTIADEIERQSKDVDLRSLVAGAVTRGLHQAREQIAADIARRTCEVFRKAEAEKWEALVYAVLDPSGPSP